MKKFSNIVNKFISWVKKDPKRPRRILFIAIGIVAIICVICINFHIKTKLHVESVSQKVTEIKQISELCTVTYINEEAIFDTIDGSSNKITVVKARGTIRAGFDLSKMTAISTSYDSIALFLPPAKILDAIINPSGFETFVQKGTWTYDDQKKAQLKARKTLLVHSVESGILKEAEKNGRNQLTSMFKAMGFKAVSITIVRDPMDIVEDVLNLHI